MCSMIAAPRFFTAASAAGSRSLCVAAVLIDVSSGLLSNVSIDDPCRESWRESCEDASFCCASARLNYPISSFASLSLSLVLFVVLAAVDIDIPVNIGPFNSFCLSLSTCSGLSSNCVPVISVILAASSFRLILDSMASSASFVLL
jgi:hypothetical protein